MYAKFITQEQTKGDVSMARTEANCVLICGKVISRTRYVICIGSVGFELGTMFYFFESLTGLFCVDL